MSIKSNRPKNPKDIAISMVSRIPEGNLHSKVSFLKNILNN